MKVKNGKEQEYMAFVNINSQDVYSKGVVDYMQKWSSMMEKEIEHGETVFDVAERTSIEVDNLGITGFMYGCAVSALSEFWEYGDDLRKWHNKKYGYEGEGTVNPAILSLG